MAQISGHGLADACKEYGMKLQFRPPATPRFGGHIERLIGTMMGAVHLLPGTTFSIVKIRGDYDTEGRANLTLRELEKWIALEIVGKYHQHIHASLLRPPLAVWRERQGEVDFNLPPDRMAFWTSFLPGERRRLLKDGIHWKRSGTGLMPCHAMLVVAPNSRSNMIQEIFPEYSFANLMAGLLKRDTAISHSRLCPGGNGSTPRRHYETRGGLNCRKRLSLQPSCNKDRLRISQHPQAQKHAGVLPDDQLNRAVKNTVPFNLSICRFGKTNPFRRRYGILGSMIELPHLAPGAAALANGPNHTRIRAIRSDR